jgi:hypothetical protein
MPTELNVIISAPPSCETIAPNEPRGRAFAGHARLEIQFPLGVSVVSV